MDDTNRQYPPIHFEDREVDQPRKVFPRYVEVGRVIYEWATGQRPHPKSMEEVREALGDGDNIFIPENMKNVEVVQGEDDDPESTTFILRLPPANQVSESQQQTSQAGREPYPTPLLYDFLIGLGALDDEGKPAKTEDVMYARIADYTMRGCR